MGWLPIILAVCGFLFFVAVVNYNSINTHKEAIMLAFFNLCQTARARNTLLKSIDGYEFREESSLAKRSELLMEEFNLDRFHEYLLYIRQEKQSMEDSKLFLRTNRPASKETRKVLKSLQVLNHRQHIHIKVFNRKVREYNQLISSYPTKMVARSTGFKTLGI